MRFYRDNLKTIPVPKTLNYQKIKIKSTDIDLTQPNIVEYLENLGTKLVKTCLHEHGIGCHAAQIGILKNAFIMQVDESFDVWDLIINPSYKPRNEHKCTAKEGCLSVPKKQYEINRATSIEVNYWFVINGKLENVVEVLDGLKARIFQHEYDHGNGLSIPDLYNRQQNKKK